MLAIYNTLTRCVEPVETQQPRKASMYTCGPTVYRYAHIGNLRSYLMADWIKRALIFNGLDVTHVKNITDVGHMRQEQLERGGDKVILAALAEGKTPAQIADFYTEAFLRDEAKLNILPADEYPKATDHIPDMLKVIELLMANGYAYAKNRNVYFSVSDFEPYGQLSGNLGEQLLEGVRAEADPLKRDPRDFTLWKSAEDGREVKWDSPWGEGFPGWHIECSAMSHRYLGERQDIHTGGVDNIFPHHEDEIAQSEAAFGAPYVRSWVHGQHLLADGVKMAKSAGNEFILSDLENRGYDPLAFRYLCLTVKYRRRLNFTFSALKASQRALIRLQDMIATWRRDAAPVAISTYADAEEWMRRFVEAVENDLNMPAALAVVWRMSRSDLAPAHKLNLALDMDRLLGLELAESSVQPILPITVAAQASDRQTYRKRGLYHRADSIRHALNDEGYITRDHRGDSFIRPKQTFETLAERWPTYSSPREAPSLLGRPSTVDFSFVVIANDYLEDVKRCVGSLLNHIGDLSCEIVAVDNGSADGSAEWLEELQRKDNRVRTLHCDHRLGDAQAKNLGLSQCLGDLVAVVDTSVEATGEFAETVKQALSDNSVGMVGKWGVRSENLRHFHEEVTDGETDAMQAYFFAFRRQTLNEVGMMRERFRFYRNLDIDFSFQFRNAGYRVVAIGELPLVRHEHRQWNDLGEDERDELSLKNFRIFLKKWGHRQDLLVS